MPIAADSHREHHLAANRRQVGRPVSDPDGLVAAIARSRGAAVATRDLAGSVDGGVPVVNPWGD